MKRGEILKGFLRPISVFAAVILCCIAMAFPVCAKVYEGTCSDTISWSCDLNTGVMTLSGQGDLPDYLNYASTPWASLTPVIKTLIIGDGITYISDSSFMYAYSLEAVEFANTVVAIGDSAFEYCASLEEISFPENLQSIGNMSFAGCKSLTSVSLPDTLSSVGSHAFGGCASLKNAHLGQNLSYLGDGAFSGCSLLESVSFGNMLTDIGEGVFYGCSELEIDELPSTVNSLGDRAFFGCTKLSTSVGDDISLGSSNVFFGTGVLFDVFWDVDGKIFSQKASYGEVPVFSESTEKHTAVLDGIYSFDGWSREPSAITTNNNGIYKAKYKLSSLISSLSAVTSDGNVQITSQFDLQSISCENAFIMFSCHTQQGEMIGCKRVPITKADTTASCSVGLKGRELYSVKASIYAGGTSLIPLCSSQTVLP